MKDIMANVNIRQTTYSVTVQESAPRESKQSDGMKRLTIDIPESLHKAVKAQCAMRGTKIADEVRELLSKKFGSL
jgi:hypothetical protein